MERSRLPLPSFLCLFGILLMLFPELLLGTIPGLSPVAVTDPGVQGALSYLVRRYNYRRRDSANYFKVLRVVEAYKQMVNGRLQEYHINMDLVKTTCQKRNRDLTYESIQKCALLPGIQPILNIYFVLDVSEEH